MSSLITHLRCLGCCLAYRCQELWDVLLREAHSRLDVLEALVQQQEQPQQQKEQQHPNTQEAGTKAVKRAKKASSEGKGVAAPSVSVEQAGVQGEMEVGGEEGGSSSGEGAVELVAAARSAARGVALVAQAVHHFRCVAVTCVPLVWVLQCL